MHAGPSNAARPPIRFATALPVHRDVAAAAALVALGLLLFAAVWLGMLGATSLVPPADNIEQLTWVRSLEWGYYKHPPLPTWLMWLPARLFGLGAWTSYGLGAACTLGALWLLWRLLVTLRGTTYAGVALLAVLCITYYNGRLNYYNHNIVLLLFSTASAALTWQAFATRRLRWWAALGLVLGLASLSKYQCAVTASAVLAFAWRQRAWRDPVHRLGLLLACLVALLVFAPHLAWLHEHDFGPVGYAIESSLGAHIDLGHRLGVSANWLADQLFNRALPALLLLALVGWEAVRRSRADLAQRPLGDSAVRDLLLAWGIAPLCFMAAAGLLLGVDLQTQWGTAFLLFAVPAAMELTGHAVWRRADLGRAWRVFIIIQLLLLTLCWVTSPRGPAALQDHHWRAFDAAQFADRIAAPARAQLGGPIRIVVGRTSFAGALALQLPDRPLVLIDGRFDRSPWLGPSWLAQCGAVEIGAAGRLPGGRPVGGAFTDFDWRVLPPQPGAGPCPPLRSD